MGPVWDLNEAFGLCCGRGPGGLGIHTCSRSVAVAASSLSPSLLALPGRQRARLQSPALTTPPLQLPDRRLAARRAQRPRRRGRQRHQPPGLALPHLRRPRALPGGAGRRREPVVPPDVGGSPVPGRRRAALGGPAGGQLERRGCGGAAGRHGSQSVCCCPMQQRRRCCCHRLPRGPAASCDSLHLPAA